MDPDGLMAQIGLGLNNFDRYSRQQPIFEVLFETEKKISELLICKILVLVNKYFSDFKFFTDINDKDFDGDWKDFLLSGNPFFDEDKSALLSITTSFHIMSGTEIISIELKKGLSIFYSGRYKPTVIVDVHADLYTDIDYVPKYEEGKGWSYEKRDNSMAAKQNREILRNFLMSLEKLIDGEVIEYHGNFDKKYLTPYGFTEDVDYDCYD
jgi:hypothetical protein